ncbi:eukaryotic translation initiation factor-like protein 5 [Melanomma pulvis-pyrius CBS 109.77]|uniref:Eukaryotic translation initiation factor-like protein 5 n=1 Tax=Melanomma pulvis-pyrius CBS 109.77 TaxID=1314802 RepID=A0A6A6WPA1_9PLEO|nr:eukaryotic translation initiation factor-like protein 5 [Melanomma pulvis-pyrius CBS 109.77]
MERLQSKIEGKGNGIKTVIVNLSSVAQSLARPPAYVIKYFGFELGAQTNTNPADDRWIINGAHDASKLQDYLDGFISKFVLCKKCKNPETEVNIKDGHIILDCKACGQQSVVDLRLKLSSFILKNQPKKGKKDKATKKAERRARKEAGANADEESQNGGSPGDSASDHADEAGEVELEANSDDELTRQINEGAREIEVEDAKEVQWSIDTSEEAIKARANDLPDDLKRALVIDDDEDGEGGSSDYDLFGKWILDTAVEKGGVDKLDNVEIYLKAQALGVEKKHRTLTVLAQTLFDENIVKQIEKRAGMIKKMITSERHEKAFLGGTERFVGKEKPELIPQVSAILLKYYENDLITEEVLKAWGSKASKKYVDIKTSKSVRKSAEKFMEWLNTAESDEEEESDEE